jgi:N-acetylglucosamine-6-sulfatase
MFEESLKMPFVIRWPHVVQAGSTATALIQNIDYGPTFLDVAGVEVPAEMQGRSLVPLLRSVEQPPADWRDAIYYAYYENAAVHAVPVHDGVRDQRYKLMFFPRQRQWHLFDLAKDPQELTSVHENEEYRQVLVGMRKRYEDLRALYDVNTATIPATRGDEQWWRDRDRARTRRAREGNVDLAFIGDSITQGWEGEGRSVWQSFFAGRNPINLGFSGDRTEHVIWRLQHGNFDNIQPKVAVVMIGTNNTGHQMQDPRQVADGIERILQLLREQSPATRILLLGVFPRGTHPYDVARLNNVAINQIIRRFADGQHIHYLDIGRVFLEADGSLSPEVMPDALHLSEEGYRRWAEAIEPKLKELGV